MFFIYLFWVVIAALGLSLVSDNKGYSLVLVCGLLIAVASPVAEHGLSGPWVSVVVVHGLQSAQ